MFPSSDSQSQQNYGLTKIGKIYRLIRLTRMFRVLKVLHMKNLLVKKITDTLKIGVGMERMVFLTLTLFIV